MDTTPRDAAETKALGYGQRISTAIGIIIAMGTALLAAFGNMQWITDNLPLLGTGVGALVTGGLTAYVAIRRMRVDKTKAASLIALIAVVPLLPLLTGCAVISGKAGESHYVGLALGEKASSTLAGLNITETQTQKGQVIVERGVGIDKAGSAGEADMGKILGSLLLLGLQSQGLPVKAPASSASQDVESAAEVKDQESEDSTDPTSGSAYVVYSTDGYGGSPGVSGEGVYGRPSCSRCRAYKSAHPDVGIINLDDSANRTAMWSALRKRGFTGSTAALPVAISPTAYEMSAK